MAACSRLVQRPSKGVPWESAELLGMFVPHDSREPCCLAALQLPTCRAHAAAARSRGHSSCAAGAQVCTLSSLLPLPLLGLVPNSSGPEAQRKAEDDAEQA